MPAKRCRHGNYGTWLAMLSLESREQSRAGLLAGWVIWTLYATANPTAHLGKLALLETAVDTASQLAC